MKHIDANGKAVLVIPDLHIPYEHPDALAFTKACYKKYVGKTGFVINLGDEVDGHAISFHKSSAELFSAGHELQEAIRKLKYWYKAFPVSHVLDSNHGSLIYRRMSDQGLPLHYIKPLKVIYNTPKWEWHEEIYLKTAKGGIYMCHGKSGTYGKLVKEMGTYGCIQGHFHGKCEITWHASGLMERFNCFSGCLIDRKSLAFAYGKNHIPKPILAVTVISKSGYPRIVMMELNEKGRWTGNLP